jgi:hypothetical protein
LPYKINTNSVTKIRVFVLDSLIFMKVFFYQRDLHKLREQFPYPSGSDFSIEALAGCCTLFLAAFASDAEQFQPAWISSSKAKALPCA